jgi:hypothetical protein
MSTEQNKTIARRYAEELQISCLFHTHHLEVLHAQLWDWHRVFSLWGYIHQQFLSPRM